MEEYDPNLEGEVCASFMPQARRMAAFFASSINLPNDQRDDCESDAMLAVLLAIRSWEPGGNSLQNRVFSKVRFALIDGVRERLGRTLNSTPEVREMHRKMNYTLDLFGPVNNRQAKKGTVQLLHETIPERPLGDLDELQKVEVRFDVAKASTILRARELQVIQQYYVEGLFMHEIADAMGVTESRISQIHRRAVDKITRHYNWDQV